MAGIWGNHILYEHIKHLFRTLTSASVLHNHKKPKMKRRTFLKTASITAVSISAFGSISWNGHHFTGSTPTTSDILGPFYRPGAPLRSNIVPVGEDGIPFFVKGRIFGNDGKTPLHNAIVEAWQCDMDEVYDNTTDDFRYRGRVKTDASGAYAFQTLMPPPYIVGDDWRPAHIHMRISHDSFQDLITQIYFKGDPNIRIDESSSSPDAVERILEVRQKNESREVLFDIVMQEYYPLSSEGFNRLEGLYQIEKGIVEFYRENHLLMMKINGQIMEGMAYKGNNLFQAANGVNQAEFKVAENGNVDVLIKMWNYPHREKEPIAFEGTKFMKY